MQQIIAVSGDEVRMARKKIQQDSRRKHRTSSSNSNSVASIALSAPRKTSLSSASAPSLSTATLSDAEKGRGKSRIASQTTTLPMLPIGKINTTSRSSGNTSGGLATGNSTSSKPSHTHGKGITRSVSTAGAVGNVSPRHKQMGTAGGNVSPQHKQMASRSMSSAGQFKMRARSRASSVDHGSPLRMHSSNTATAGALQTRTRKQSSVGGMKHLPSLDEALTTQKRVNATKKLSQHK